MSLRDVSESEISRENSWLKKKNFLELFYCDIADLPIVLKQLYPEATYSRNVAKRD